MYYLLALIVPPLRLLANLRLWARRRSLFTLAVLSSFLMYGVTVSSAFAASEWYAYQFETFDLNRDGVITLEERSPEQSEAMDRMTNDAGRNMTVFFGALWAIAVSTVFFALAGTFQYVAGKWQKTHDHRR